MTDDEGKRIQFPPQRAKRSDPAETPPDKPIDAKTTKTEIQRSLCTIYNLLHKLMRDDERYSPGDFAEEADGLVELMNQHAPLRIILRVLTPIAAVAALIEKVQGTVERFRFRKAREQQAHQLDAQPEATNHQVNVQMQESASVASPAIDRGVFKRGPFG